MNGTHPIHRALLDHWIWKDKPFARGQAWIDMILLANHKDNKVIIKAQIIEIKRGQIAYSHKSLAKRWGWTRSKVRRFMTRLKTDHMIDHLSDHLTTTTTLLNYDRLHKEAFKKRPPNRPPNRPTNEHLTPTDNNGNNDKEVIQLATLTLKKSFLDTKKEIYPMLDIEGEIRKCVDWFHTKGVKIRSWEKTITNWLKKAYDSKGVITSTQPIGFKKP